MSKKCAKCKRDATPDRRLCPKCNSYQLAYQKRRRDENKSQLLCSTINCDRPAKLGRTRCLVHAKKNAAYSEKYRDKNKSKEPQVQSKIQDFDTVL